MTSDALHLIAYYYPVSVIIDNLLTRERNTFEKHLNIKLMYGKMVGFGAFDSEKLVSFFQDNFKQKQNPASVVSCEKFANLITYLTFISL